jgi:predicted transcriptional regulator
MEEIHLPTPRELRRKIRNALDKNEMTQKELADEVDTSEGSFSGWMNYNRTLSYETVYQIWVFFQQANSETGHTAADLMESDIVWADPSERYEDVAQTMMDNAYTQLPVCEDGDLLGWITTEVLAEKGEPDLPIRDLVHNESFGTIESYANEEAVRDALTGDSAYRALLVTDDSEYVGILTREDLVRAKVEDT